MADVLPIPSNPKFIDRTGEEIGALHVVGYAGATKSGGSRWLCRCKCGRERVVVGGNFCRMSTSPKCRCYIHDGLSTKPIYKVWLEMLGRCNNPNHRDFANYGGRGVSVCKRWFSLKLFFADMGHPPRGLTLERRDVNGDYVPDNCRWATWSEQQCNRRNNHFVEWNGKRLTISQWASRTGINQGTLHWRLTRGGWAVERALTTPGRHR